MSADLPLDRRTALVGLLGVAGAGGTIGLSQAGRDKAAAIRPVSPAQPIRVEAGADGIRRVALAPVPIGAGGFISGMDISADGTRFVCRTDVANAYVRDVNDAFWRPFFSPTTLAPHDRDPLPDAGDKADGNGVSGIRIAPSNKNVIFASFLGYVWKSSDGGRTVQRTRFPQKRILANSGWQRLFNPTIDIHPTDPASVMVGTWGEGVWFTADGGNIWRQSRLPAATNSLDNNPGIHLVLFDPSNPDRVYAFVTGFGLYRSNNGPGGQFEPLPGGPAYCSNIVAGRDGSIFACEHTKETNGGRVFRYLPASGWSSTLPDREGMVLAIDPSKPERSFLIEPYGLIMKSEDNAATFTRVGNGEWAEQGGEIRWMGGLTSLFPSQILFDPRSSNRLWIAQGVGVAMATIGRSGVALEDWSAGIEELCARSVLSVPGGKTFLAALDKPFWRVDSLSSFTNDFRYPVVAGTEHTANLVAFASYMDYAPENPRFLVGVVSPNDKVAPGFTSDGGDSWQAFSGKPETGWGVGGCIAAASTSNFILLPSNNAIGVFTLDGGKSWSPVKLDGRTPTGGFANAFYVARKNISADKSRPGTFALVYTTIQNDEYGNPMGGLWLTRDGGRSWNQQYTGLIGTGGRDPRVFLFPGMDNRQFWQCQLEFVPGRPGELVYTPHADASADRFWWSGDDGRTWSELHKSVRNVGAFGFGKAAPGQPRPALYFWGEVGGRKGLYASFDWLATPPKLLTRFPSELLSNVTCIGGDPNQFGRAIVGTACAGWVRIDVQF